MEHLQTITNALDKATREGAFTLSEVDTILVSVRATEALLKDNKERIIELERCLKDKEEPPKFKNESFRTAALVAHNED